MTHQGVREYVEAIKERYGRATRKVKGRILDEAERVTGYHRKALIRLLRGSGKASTSVSQRRGRPRHYGPEVAEALRVVWEASGRICSRRLHPFVGELAEVLKRHGEQRLEPQVETQLRSMSPATIDRLLRPVRLAGVQRRFSTTKPGSLLKSSIPIRTFADWKEDRPGFVEVDLVAHCGDSTEGFYLNTLNTVDVATGWIECEPVWGKGQERVGSAVHHIRQRLPFPMLGLDSDNGSEFINHHLATYLERHDITFTRSRPYKKNDSAHIEQKNWTVVRQLVGYDRYSSKPALDVLRRLYRALRLHINFFQPVMKLQRKTRHGAKVHKVYDQATTPYQRLVESGVLAKRQRLAAIYAATNSVRLHARIEDTLNKLWDLADLNGVSEGPELGSLVTT